MKGLKYEIDVYPFWTQTAIMEIELKNEEQKFDIPELKKAGEHEATVYSSDNIIATGLKFEVKKEGASERKFF